LSVDHSQRAGWNHAEGKTLNIAMKAKSVFEEGLIDLMDQITLPVHILSLQHHRVVCYTSLILTSDNIILPTNTSPTGK
jgi:hypothetical protein